MSAATWLPAVAGLLLAVSAPASAESLRQRIEARDGWVAHEVPIIAGAGAPCCFEGHAGVRQRRPCDLDSRNWSFGSDGDEGAAAKALTVYWHVSGGRIDSVRAFADTCPVAGAAGLRRLEAVDAAASAALVADRIGEADSRTRSDPLAVLAYHAGPQSLLALERFSQDGQPQDIREQALFWLGHARGPEGMAIVERVARSDTDLRIREHAVFALSQGRGGDAYARLRTIAREDASAAIRGKALFWMAQMDVASARDDILAAVRGDPSDEVREEAVFALAQLDAPAGDEALIALVRGDYPRAVKQKALFWLGQSGSQRALDFIDSVLAPKAAPRS